MLKVCFSVSGLELKVPFAKSDPIKVLSVKYWKYGKTMIDFQSLAFPCLHIFDHFVTNPSNFLFQSFPKPITLNFRIPTSYEIE